MVGWIVATEGTNWGAIIHPDNDLGGAFRFSGSLSRVHRCRAERNIKLPSEMSSFDYFLGIWICCSTEPNWRFHE